MRVHLLVPNRPTFSTGRHPQESIGLSAKLLKVVCTDWSMTQPMVHRLGCANLEGSNESGQRHFNCPMGCTNPRTQSEATIQVTQALRRTNAGRLCHLHIHRPLAYENDVMPMSVSTARHPDRFERVAP